jgi:isopentenyl diphosphate isomerase/L-lactate dehydrogenase-like FMN-dependent dehydrogenase
MSFDAEANRRRFLKFLAASPLFAAGAGPALAETLLPKARQPDPLMWGPLDPAELIKTPKEAINVFDFEPVCRQNVPPAHFGYMAAGIDDEVTLRANRQDFQKFVLRPRRLVDVSKVSMKTEILGVTYDSPIFICPIGSNKAYNPDGEIAVAKAAKIGNHLQMLSTVATSSVEDVTAARGQPIVQQLYATNRWEVAQTIVKNAENAGALAVAVTVDRSGGRNQETLFRLRRTDTRQCSSCHDRTNMTTDYAHKPNIARADLTGLKSLQSSAMTWDFFKRLRDITKMKIIVKGILVPEDAAIAADNGIDAILVSNHGGRADDAGLSTIETLPDIVAAVNGRTPILVDSGFRRGTDVVKALCMGATAVGIGRPYIWGLGAFGQAGVERVLELLRVETRAMMQQMGAPTINDLKPAMVRRIAA